MAASMFFTTNTVNSFNEDVDIAMLVSISSANAEDNNPSGVFGEEVLHTYSTTITIGGGPVPGSYSETDTYSKWECDGWWGWCW